MKNRNKLTILIFLPAIIEVVQDLLISNMHNKLEEDTCEKLSRLQGQIIDVKWEKSQ